jgi:adenylate cyclase
MPLAAKVSILRRVHPALLAGAFIIIFTAVVALGQRTFALLDAAENFAGDYMAGIFEPFAAQHPDIILLRITEDTLSDPKEFPFRFPINRDFLARTLDLLAERGAKAVALDLLFDQSTRKEDDARFQETARRYPVPLIVGWSDAATLQSESRYKFQAEYLQGVRAGFVNTIKTSSDGTIREAFPGREENGVWRPSFSGAIAEALGKTAPKEPFRINYRMGPDLATPAFKGYAIEKVKILPAAWFKDKIVVIGADLPHEDRHRTPFAAVYGNDRGTIPGTQIQAHILAQLLDGTTPRARNRAAQLGVVFVLGCLALAIAVWEKGVAVQMVAGGAVVATLWAIAAALHYWTTISLPVVVPSLGFGLGLFGTVAYVGHLRRLEGQFIRQAFSQYVAPGVLKNLESTGMQLGGEKREVSLLFTDIEGFTTFAEKQEPTVLINVVNRYLDALTDEVFRHGGMVDKYIGDAVMAVFGAPEPQADHAKRAIECVMAMRNTAERLRNELKVEGYVFGKTRLGVHSGFAVIGNVGGERKFNYTAIGDVVNTASRLEGANKHFGTDICLSGETCRMAGFDRVRPIGRLVVKGRIEGLPVMTPVTDNELLQTDSYMAAYQLMTAGNEQAAGAFAAHVKKWPLDRLAQFHLDRLKTGSISDLIVLEGK